MLPPVFIVEIPFNSFYNTCIKCILRLPSKLSLYLGRVYSISSVMSRSVYYKLDKALWLPQRLKYCLYNFKVCSLIVTSDIVNFTDSTLSYYQVDSLTMVCNIESVSYIITFSVYRKLLIIECSAYNKRNKLLREMVRSVVV